MLESTPFKVRKDKGFKMDLIFLGNFSEKDAVKKIEGDKFY
jgi:hypothetical protein